MTSASSGKSFRTLARREAAALFTLILAAARFSSSVRPKFAKKYCTKASISSCVTWAPLASIVSTIFCHPSRSRLWRISGSSPWHSRHLRCMIAVASPGGSLVSGRAAAVKTSASNRRFIEWRPLLSCPQTLSEDFRHRPPLSGDAHTPRAFPRTTDLAALYKGQASGNPPAPLPRLGLRISAIGVVTPAGILIEFSRLGLRLGQRLNAPRVQFVNHWFDNLGLDDLVFHSSPFVPIVRRGRRFRSL